VTRCLPGGARAERGAAGSRRATGAAREHARRRRETVRRRESGLTSVKVLQISRRTRMMNQIRKQQQIIGVMYYKVSYVFTRASYSSLLYSLFSLHSFLFSLHSFLFSLLSSLFSLLSFSLRLELSPSPPHHWAIKPLSKRGLMASAVARPVDCSRARKRDETQTESRAA